MHVPMVTHASLKIPYIVTLLSLHFIYTFAHYTCLIIFYYTLYIVVLCTLPKCMPIALTFQIVPCLPKKSLYMMESCHLNVCIEGVHI